MHNLLYSLRYTQKQFKFLVSLDFFKGIMSYYAVAKGKNPGIYSTWDECKAQVHQFSGPVFKKFKSKSEAESFIKERSGALSNYSKTAGVKKTSLLATEKTYALGKNNRQTSSSSKRCLSTKSDSDEEENIIVKRKKCFESNKSSDSKNPNGFVVDDDGYTEVFTDGACSSNGRGNAKAGVGIWFSDNHQLNVSQPVNGRATNNMAEIQAVTIAARQAQKGGIKKLKISTDSQFLINCITQWMPKWKRCGWQTSNGKPVINKTELIEMEKALAPLEVRWNHVRGHVGIYGNEMADKLARDGSERYRQK